MNRDEWLLAAFACDLMSVWLLWGTRKGELRWATWLSMGWCALGAWFLFRAP